MKAHIFVLGFVQGVGYRRYIKKNALKRDIKGFVRNLPDNRVEAVFEGEKEKVEEMIEISEKGPFLSLVKFVDVKWEEDKDEFPSFEILK